MVAPFLASFSTQLLVGVSLMVLAFLITPQPKPEKPEASRDLPDPTAEAGRPIVVVFGTTEVKGSNIIDYMDKGKEDLEVNV